MSVYVFTYIYIFCLYVLHICIRPIKTQFFPDLGMNQLELIWNWLLGESVPQMRNF